MTPIRQEEKNKAAFHTLHTLVVRLGGSVTQMTHLTSSDCTMIDILVLPHDRVVQQVHSNAYIQTNVVPTHMTFTGFLIHKKSRFKTITVNHLYNNIEEIHLIVFLVYAPQVRERLANH